MAETDSCIRDEALTDLLTEFRRGHNDGEMTDRFTGILERLDNHGIKMAHGLMKDVSMDTDGRSLDLYVGVHLLDRDRFDDDQRLMIQAETVSSMLYGKPSQRIHDLLDRLIPLAAPLNDEIDRVFEVANPEGSYLIDEACWLLSGRKRSDEVIASIDLVGVNSTAAIIGGLLEESCLNDSYRKLSIGLLPPDGIIIQTAQLHANGVPISVAIHSI